MIDIIFTIMLSSAIHGTDEFKNNISKTLFLKGSINDKKVEYIENNVNNINYLVVSSYGGSELSALRLANIIRENNINIIIDGLCMSACAFYLLPSSDSIQIKNDSIISFHSSVIGVFDAISDGVLDANLEKQWIEHVENTRQLYASQNIDFRVFYDSLKVLGINCFEVDEYNNIDNIYMNREIWVPSKEYMHDIGFKMNGYWPKSKDIFKNNLNKHGIENISWIYGGEVKHINAMKFSKSIDNCK